MGAGATFHNCASSHKRRVLEGAPLHVWPFLVHGPVLVVGPTGVERTYARAESEPSTEGVHK